MYPLKILLQPKGTLVAWGSLVGLAGLFSAAALPRLLGPALLTLVFFLWESFVGAEAPTRRDPRFIWQLVLLVLALMRVHHLLQQLLFLVFHQHHSFHQSQDFRLHLQGRALKLELAR